MDKELLKKYKLEETQKRFQQICEYSFITKPVLNEEGDDEEGQQPQGGNPQDDMQQPPMAGPDGNSDMMPQGNESQPPVDNGMNQPQQGGDAMNQPPVPEQPASEIPDDMDKSEEGDDNVDTMQDGDEVVDVDDLTNAQETTEVKIDGVNDKLQNLLAVTTKFIAAVDQNNQKIDDLRAEFERRNPSQEEKFNIRSQASAPYSETPRGFWDKKTQDSNYNVIYNNDVDPDKEDKEYVIRKGDINGNDDRMLAKSLDYPSKLTDFINF